MTDDRFMGDWAMANLCGFEIARQEQDDETTGRQSEG